MEGNNNFFPEIGGKCIKTAEIGREFQKLKKVIRNFGG